MNNLNNYKNAIELEPRTIALFEKVQGNRETTIDAAWPSAEDFRGRGNLLRSCQFWREIFFSTT